MQRKPEKDSRHPVWSEGGSFSLCREISTASRRTAQSCTTEVEGRRKRKVRNLQQSFIEISQVHLFMRETFLLDGCAVCMDPPPKPQWAGCWCTAWTEPRSCTPWNFLLFWSAHGISHLRTEAKIHEKGVFFCFCFLIISFNNHNIMSTVK